MTLRPKRQPPWGEQFRKARENQGITQEQLAKSLGCSKQTISLIESRMTPPIPRRESVAELGWKYLGLGEIEP